jgi:hypothetical protein
MAVFGHQRARGTQGHAGSAKGAARFLQGFFMGSGGTRFQTPAIVIDGAHCDQIVVCPDAFPAENALGEIPDDKRIGLLESRVVGHRIQARRSDPQLCGKKSQFASIPFIADNAGLGMVGHDETQDVPPVPLEVGGVCPDRHAGCNRGDAGSHHPAAFFIFHHAEPACPGRLKVGMMTQGRYPDAVFAGRVENTRPCLSDDVHSIDAKADLFHCAPLNRTHEAVQHPTKALFVISTR